jgi:hypothetical protein
LNGFQVTRYFLVKKVYSDYFNDSKSTENESIYDKLRREDFKTRGVFGAFGVFKINPDYILMIFLSFLRTSQF